MSKPKPSFALKIDPTRATEDITAADIAALESFLDNPPTGTNPLWLKDDQVKALRAVIMDMKNGFRQNYVVEPPGFGKTLLHIYLMKALMKQDGELQDRQVIWVAPNQSLIDKNIDELKKHAPELAELVTSYSGVEKGDIKPGSIVCCTPAMFVRLTQDELPPFERQKQRLYTHIGKALRPEDRAQLLEAIREIHPHFSLPILETRGDFYAFITEQYGQDIDSVGNFLRAVKKHLPDVHKLHEYSNEGNGHPNLKIDKKTILLVDEQHQMLSELRDGELAKYREADALKFGLTATPYLSNGKSVGEVAYEGRKPSHFMGFHEAVTKGYLCNIAPMIMNVRVEVAKTERDRYVAEIIKKHPEFTQAQIDSAIRSKLDEISLKKRMELVVHAWGNDINPHTGEALFKQQGIVFCPGVPSARNLANLYNEKYGHLVPEGTTVAAVITSKMSQGEKDEIWKRYKEGKIYILTNVRCAATGLDYPKIGFVETLWETSSLALLAQEIGRGARVDIENLSKILLARQWVDFKSNRKCALITEALESNKPIYNYNFTPPNPLGVETYEFHQPKKDINVNVCATPIALETVTRVKQATLDKDKALLPPLPEGYNEFVTARRFCEIIAEYSEKTPKHHELRTIVDMLLKKLTKQFPDNELMLGEEYTASGVRIIMAGTDRGNQWHFSYDQFCTYFLDFIQQTKRADDFSGVKKDLDDVTVLNHFDYWGSIVELVKQNLAHAPQEQLNSEINELRAKLEDEYNKAQERLPADERYCEILRSESTGIDFRLNSPGGLIVTKHEQVLKYLEKQLGVTAEVAPIIDRYSKIITRENFGTGEYINLADAQNLLRNIVAMMPINPFSERDIKNIAQSLDDEAKSVSFDDIPCPTKFGVSLIRKSGTGEVIVNLGDLKYYILKRAEQETINKFEQIEKSLSAKSKPLSTPLGQNKEVYVPLPSTKSNQAINSCIQNYGFSISNLYPTSGDIFRDIIICAQQNYKAMPIADRTRPIDIVLNISGAVTDQPTFATYNGINYCGGSHLKDQDINKSVVDSTITIRCVTIDGEPRFFAQLSELNLFLMDHGGDFNYSRRLHARHKNESESVASYETFFKYMDNHGLDIRTELKNDFAATVESSAAAKMTEEVYVGESPLPYAENVYLAKFYMPLFVTAFSRDISKENPEQQYMYGIWPVMETCHLSQHFQRLSIHGLEHLNQQLDDEKMKGISKLSREEVEARMKLKFEATPYSSSLTVDQKSRLSDISREIDRETINVQNRLFKAILNYDKNTMVRILDSYPELTNTFSEIHKMSPLLYAASKASEMCFLELCKRLTPDEINAYDKLGNHVLLCAANPDVNHFGPDAGLRNTQHLIETLHISPTTRHASLYTTVIDHVVGSCSFTQQQDCILHPKTYRYLRDLGVEATKAVDETRVVKEEAWSGLIAAEFKKRAA